MVGNITLTWFRSQVIFEIQSRCRTICHELIWMATCRYDSLVSSPLTTKLEKLPILIWLSILMWIFSIHIISLLLYVVCTSRLVPWWQGNRAAICHIFMHFSWHITFSFTISPRIVRIMVDKNMMYSYPP